MATEVPAAKRARTDSGRRDTLTCALCLEVFTSPKMLPCHHTFCLPCLQRLTSHRPAPSFPCPQCRHNVVIPPGGVAAFQSNFYLPPDELQAARDGAQCLVHAEQQLDMYCLDCRLPLCAKCVLAAHKLHATTERAQALQHSREQLAEDEQRLQQAVSSVIEGVAGDQAELQAVRDKTAAVESVIRRKHAALLAMADSYRDDSLARLRAVGGAIEGRLKTDLASKTANLDQLCLLQQRQQAASIGDDDQLLQMAHELREGWGLRHTVRHLAAPARSSLHRPVLSCPVPDVECRRIVRGFLGAVVDEAIPCTAREVTVRQQFRCGREGEDTEVFSLCPNHDGSKVCISFTRRGLQENAPIQKYDEHGAHISTHDEATGRHSWKSRGAGRGLCARQTPTCLQTYDKSHKDAVFKLVNDLSGLAHVRTSTVLTEDPLTQQQTTEFTIQVGPHRGFDVSGDEQVFVVVEEARAPDVQRKVKLYRRHTQVPVATYSPPAPACQPADACFFTLGGREVVLIADEAMDCIHVAAPYDVAGPHDVAAGPPGVAGPHGVVGPTGPVTTLRFERYLAPGCPLLVQPTALNVDSRGRLWVACRSGAILTCTPIA